MNIKLWSNAFSTIHASLAIYLLSVGNYETVQKVSTIYFLLDLIYVIGIAKYSRFTKMLLIYHHLVSTYCLQNFIYFPVIRRVILWGELSNLSSYIVYYYLHIEGDHTRKLRFFKQVQLVVYVFARVIMASYFMVLMHRLPTQTLFYIIFPIYLMGVSWSSTMICVYFRKKLKN